MKHKLEKLHEHTSKLSLTQEEKFDMLQNIRAYSNNSPIHSPYILLFKRQSFVYASIFALLIGTSATSFAAEGSLPGDILYPVKTNINEEIAKTLSFSNEQKTKTSVNLVDKRLSELEQMIVEEKDTPEKIEVIFEKLEEHKEELKTIQKDEDMKESQNSVATYIALESIVDTHIDILEDIADDKNIEDVISNLKDDKSEDSNTSTSTQDQKDEKKNQDESNKAKNTPIKKSESNRRDAFLQITKFSSEIDSLVFSAKAKVTDSDKATSTQIRKDVRKHTIEEAKERLDEDVEVEIDIREDDEDENKDTDRDEEDRDDEEDIKREDKGSEFNSRIEIEVRTNTEAESNILKKIDSLI